MAEETKEKKPSPASLFREKLQNREKLKETIIEGLKNGNAKVRSLATKAAFKLHDHELVKKNVLPLIHSDKSKKVLRAISDKITRRALVKRVNTLLVPKKKAGKKGEAAAEGASAAPAAPAKG